MAILVSSAGPPSQEVIPTHLIRLLGLELVEDLQRLLFGRKPTHLEDGGAEAPALLFARAKGGRDLGCVCRKEKTGRLVDGDVCSVVVQGSGLLRCGKVAYQDALVRIRTTTIAPHQDDSAQGGVHVSFASTDT